MINAINGFVVVRPLKEQDNKSKGGITLVSGHCSSGIITAEVLDSSDNKIIKGSKVAVYKQGSFLSHGGEEYYFVKGEDILGVITDDVAK